MLSSLTLYPLVLSWLQVMGVARHRTSRAAVGAVLTALLCGQSLRPSVLVRALPDPVARPARTGYRRVARVGTCRCLTPAALTAALVRAVLMLTGCGQPGGAAPYLALDSVRLGRWEIFTLGPVWHGRVLPVSFAVLPSPWPKGRFTPTVCALIRQVAQAWPATVPRPHLLADRAFPSGPLIATLVAVGWGFTIRLRARDGVTVAGQVRVVREVLATTIPEGWTIQPGAFGTQVLTVPTWVVIGQGLVVLPHHQRDAASARVRARRRARKLHDVKQQHLANPTEPWVALLTTLPTWPAAVTAYRHRYPTEGTYRDLQTGWDGRHGWDLGAQVARIPAGEPARVEALVGLSLLGYLLQCWVGHQVGLPGTTGNAPVTQAWTVHGRLSVWARGRLALTDPTGRLATAGTASLTAGARRLALSAAPAPLPAPRPTARAA
jgi:hypothetical protein